LELIRGFRQSGISNHGSGLGISLPRGLRSG
jgi:hypothetical protein